MANKRKEENVEVEETVKKDAEPVEAKADETAEALKQEATTEEAKTEESTKSIEQLVKEVVKGLHGTGRERMLSLGDRYEEVQHEVNQLIKKGEI
jgi:hypothetical protein